MAQWNDLPKCIQERMLFNQMSQGKQRSASVFENLINADENGDGFKWSESPEGYGFWYSIINEGDFEVYYRKYPIERELNINTITMSNVKYDKLPQAIKDKILAYQVEQGNERNEDVFIKELSASVSGGGFAWGRTTEGNDFWAEILSDGNFSGFYKMYGSISSRVKYEQYKFKPMEIVKLYDGKYALKKNALKFSEHSMESGWFLKDNDDSEIILTVDGYGHEGCDDLLEFRGDWYFTDRLDRYNIVWDLNCEEYDYKHNCNRGYINSRGNMGWFSEGVYSDRHDCYFINDEVANNLNYYYVEVCDDYIHEDYMHHYEPKRNATYHDLERKWSCPTDTKFTIGFEVEKEDDDAVDIKYEALYEDTKWIKENDGSLDSDNGYELVSPVYDIFSKELEKDIATHSDLVTLIDGEYSSSCGGHINIGSSQYKTRELAEGLSCFYPLLYAMYENRLGGEYCRAKVKNEYVNGNKYSAIYIKSNVLEFRIFPAVRNVENLIWRRDLMRIFVNNINKSEVDVLKMLVNKNSLLYKHLSKIFSPERIQSKANLFIKYSKMYNNRNLDNNRGGLAI